MNRILVRAVPLVALAALAPLLVRRAHAPGTVVPAAADTGLAPSGDGGHRATAVLAGGCFWGVEAVFEHVRGVLDVVSGYAGGAADETVAAGATRHAESVRITFDPARVSYATLLRIYFAVAHDPTQLDRQGPDVGPQYRSEVFAVDSAQARIARAYLTQLDRAGVFGAPIVTKVAMLDRFYPAEAYHQDFMLHHPDDPYVVYNDRPKLAHLQQAFPALYRAEWPAPAAP